MQNKFLQWYQSWPSGEATLPEQESFARVGETVKPATVLGSQKEQLPRIISQPPSHLCQIEPNLLCARRSCILECALPAMENQSDTECSNDGDYQQSIEYPERNDLVAWDNDETDYTEVESGDNEDNNPDRTQGDGKISWNTTTSAVSGATDSFPTENVDGTMPAEESSGDHQEVNRAFFDDVIGGRGKQTCNHFGNQNFRRLIRTHCETYGALVGNANKTRFVEDIVTEVKLTGRFLKTKKGGNSFVEMTDEEARRKVGQSLRYELRKVQDQRG